MKKFLGILFILILISYPIESNTPHLPCGFNKVAPEVVNPFPSFNRNLLIDKIKKMNFPFPEIVLAQAQLETGNFTSLSFIKGHNLFGMKQARIRITTAQGSLYGHAYYKNWQSSLIDYALYYSSYMRQCKNKKEYFRYLKENYSEDKHYVRRLKRIIRTQNLEKYFN